jgi:hypothetical protein
LRPAGLEALRQLELALGLADADARGALLDERRLEAALVEAEVPVDREDALPGDPQLGRQDAALPVEPPKKTKPLKKE